MQTVSTRTVVPLLIFIQLQLQTKVFNFKIIGTSGLLFDKLALHVALVHQRAQHSFQRLAVIGKSNLIDFAVHLLIGRLKSGASSITR